MIRLSTSPYFCLLVVATIATLCCDEAFAVTDGAECGLLDGADVLPGISHLDVWAGVSSFSDAFKRQSDVVVEETAWIEWAPAACMLLQSFVSAVHWCGDFFQYAWINWKFNYDLIVTAGPSCCPFSVSGKRLRQKDPRACQGLETARLTVLLGALALIIENVANFVDEEHLHHLGSDIDQYLLSNGMVAIGVWRLFDYQLGGASGRERVFLRWEKEEMASCLPPLGPEPGVVRPSAVLDYLDPLDDVLHPEVGGQSEFVEGVYPTRPGQASRVGSLWIRGPEGSWMPGEALKFKGD